MQLSYHPDTDIEIGCQRDANDTSYHGFMMEDPDFDYLHKRDEDNNRMIVDG